MRGNKAGSNNRTGQNEAAAPAQEVKRELGSLGGNSTDSDWFCANIGADLQAIIWANGIEWGVLQLRLGQPVLDFRSLAVSFSNGASVQIWGRFLSHLSASSLGFFSLCNFPVRSHSLSFLLLLLRRCIF